MSDEYSIEALENDIAELIKDIKSRDAELARLQSGLAAADEIMKRAVEESARLREENEQIAKKYDALRAVVAQYLDAERDEEWRWIIGMRALIDADAPAQEES